MSERFNYDEAVDFLERCTSLEETEAGEFWKQLANIHHRAEDMGSNEFIRAVEKEIRDVYYWLKDHSVIIDEEITQTYKSQRLEFLE